MMIVSHRVLTMYNYFQRIPRPMWIHMMERLKYQTQFFVSGSKRSRWHNDIGQEDRKRLITHIFAAVSVVLAAAGCDKEENSFGVGGCLRFSLVSIHPRRWTDL